MFGLSSRVSSVVALLVVGGFLVGCTSTPLNRPPVVDRGATVVSAMPVLASPNVPLVKPPQGFENAGKPGYYTVKPGDTMTRIALESGQSSKDIARWSGVENPNKIEVGQVLRVVAPVPSSMSSASVAGSAGVVTLPVTQGTVTATGNAAPPSSTTVTTVQVGGGDD
ncbi:MAG: LysM peptidoglycan-binding domain-containing protein, partial [Rhodoferax sp.]|nr:LysM peptidoglycan-binding domain-containing protein [Rhodoferax sp.]